jgi:hypothetical protein
MTVRSVLGAYRRSTRDVTLERRGSSTVRCVTSCAAGPSTCNADADDRVVLVIDMLIAIISPFLDAPMPQPGDRAARLRPAGASAFPA